MPRTGVGARLFRPAPEDPLIYSPHVRPAAHNLSMKSRVHPKYKTKYHVRNWASYEHALVRRGNLTVWLSVVAKGARSPLSPRVPPDHCSPRITLEQSFDELQREQQHEWREVEAAHRWQHAANGIERWLSQRAQDDRHGVRRRQLDPRNDDSAQHNERVEVDQLGQHDEAILLWHGPLSPGRKRYRDLTAPQTLPCARDLPTRHDRFPRSPGDHSGRLNECLDT